MAGPPTPNDEVKRDEHQRTNIDEDGDVLLIAGTEQKGSFRVSSKVLSTASSVFKAMFDPNFKEGFALSQRQAGQVCEINLPSDNPEAMEILLRLLHFQNDSLPLPASLGVHKFKQFAMVCDKYNCNEAVSFVAEAWTKELLPQPRPDEETWALIQAVSFLDLPAAFQGLTKSLILNSVDNFLDRKLEDDAYTFHALELHVALERQREALRQVLYQDLMDPIFPLIHKEGFNKTPVVNNTINHGKYFEFCLHDALQVSTYLRELHRLKLWPLDFSQTSLATMLQKLYQYEEREIGPSMGFRMHGRFNDCLACTFDPRNKLQALIDKINNDTGVCLDCLRRGSPVSSPESECRIKHV